MASRSPVVLLLLASALVVPACRHKATFDENYNSALENMKKGKYEQAQQQLQHAYLQNPASIGAKYQLALVELKLHDERSAYSLLREAEEKDHHQSAVAIPIRIELAKLFVSSKQYDQAQKRLVWILAKDAHNKGAHTLLAISLAGLAQPAAAQEQVDLLLAEDPQSLSGRVLGAALHLAVRETQQAEQSLQEEVTLTQRSTDSLVTLANFYQLTRQPAKAIDLFNEVIKREPQNIPVRRAVGWVYAQSGDRPSAERTFREIAQLAPADPAAATAVANYYVIIGDWQKAATEMEAVIAKKPDAQSRGVLASVYYRAGRRADAQKLTTQLIKENGQDANAHLVNGLLHMDAKEFEAASQDFDQVLHFQSDSAPAEYLLALASFGAGKEQNALQQMERAVQLNKELLAARLWLMDYHLRRGSPDAALNLARPTPESQTSAPAIVVMTALCKPDADLTLDEQSNLQRALLARPDMIIAYRDLGMTTLLRKYGGPLRDQLEAVVKKVPEYRPAQAMLIAVLEAQGKQDQAVAQVQQQVAANPKSAPNLLTLAKMQIKRGEFAAARANLIKADVIQAGNPEVLVRMAEVDADLGHLDDALSDLNAVTERYPKFSEGYSFKAIVYQQRGDATRARSLYEEALKLDNRNAVAANNLAYLMAFEFKDPARGLLLARQARTIDAGNPEFADTLGWIEYRMTHYPEALQALGDAVRMKPDDASFRYHLGMAQSHAGRDQEALASLEAAMRLNSAIPEAKEIEGAIATLRTRTVR